LRTLPFPEQSEELRLELVNLLGRVFEIGQERLEPFANDVIDGIAKALSDNCPDTKKKCCELVKLVALHFSGDRVARSGTPLVAALVTNLRHQQWKVRKSTLESLGACLSLEEPLISHMDEVLPHLGSLSEDRTPAVRQSLAAVLELWLVRGFKFKESPVAAWEDDGSPAGFAKFEHRILLLLLGAIADEDVDTVAKFAFGALERVGAAKHEALQEEAKLTLAREQAKWNKRVAKMEANGEKPDIPPPTLQEPELGVDFDYTGVQPLLPEPFANGLSPSRYATAVLKLHLPSILPQVLGNLTQWTTAIRTHASRQLRVFLVVANVEVAPFLEGTLVHLYKAASDDESVVAKAALQCAQMIGALMPQDLVLGLVGKHLGLRPDGAKGHSSITTEELWPQSRAGRQLTRTVKETLSMVGNFSASTIENKRQVLAVLAKLLRPSPPGITHGDVRDVLRFLEDGIQNDDLLPWVLGVSQSLLLAGGRACVPEWPRVFDLFLRMRSGDECDSSAVDKGMDDLASLCGRTRRKLYEDHLGTRLGELLLDADVALWDEKLPNRHLLDTLMRNAGDAAAPYIDRLVRVIARQACPDDAGVLARIDLLGLTHFLVNETTPAIADALRASSPVLLKDVLIPNCSWRAGQSNTKIRKGSMVCMHALLQKRLVDPAALNGVFADMMPILKSALDDSWSPDNRMIACMVLSATMSELSSEVTSEQLREVYPELLKRLDDSNDKIRIAVCDALCMFFKCLPPNWSRSLYEYILRTLFIHLDVPNLDIQQAIYAVLESSVHHDCQTFIEEVSTAATKSSHPRMCQDLKRLAESLAMSDFPMEEPEV